MALIHMDGFDEAPTGYIASYSPYTVGSYSEISSPGVFDYGKCLRGTNYYTVDLGISFIGYGFTSSNPIIICCHRYFTSRASSYCRVFAFYEDSTLHLYVHLNSSLAFEVYRGNGTLLGTSSPQSIANTWIWLSIKVYVHDTSGYVELKLNGTTILNLTGIDTRNGGTSGTINFARVHFTGLYEIGGMLDNLFILDTSGSAPFNDHLDEHRIVLAYPTANGGENDFTASTGNKYDCVDDTAWNDDTDYIYSTTSEHKQSFSTGSISGLPSTVSAVGVWARLRKADADAVSIKLFNRQSSTNYSSSSFTIGSSYANYLKFWETNPATSSAWTSSEVNNCEIGVSID